MAGEQPRLRLAQLDEFGLKGPDGFVLGDVSRRSSSSLLPPLLCSFDPGEIGEGESGARVPSEGGAKRGPEGGGVWGLVIGWFPFRELGRQGARAHRPRPCRFSLHQAARDVQGGVVSSTCWIGSHTRPGRSRATGGRVGAGHERGGRGRGPARVCSSAFSSPADRTSLLAHVIGGRRAEEFSAPPAQDARERLADDDVVRPVGAGPRARRRSSRRSAGDASGRAGRFRAARASFDVMNRLRAPFGSRRSVSFRRRGAGPRGRFRSSDLSRSAGASSFLFSSRSQSAPTG